MPSNKRQPEQRNCRKSGSGQEGGLRTETVPERSGEDTGDQRGETTHQIEQAIGRATQLRRRCVGDECRQQSLREPHAGPRG